MAERNDGVDQAVIQIDDSDGDGRPTVPLAQAVAADLRIKLNGINVGNGCPKICKVPYDVRRKHEDAYDPKIISIGPFHRKKECVHPMEQVKLLYVRELLARDEAYNQLESYAEEIGKLEEVARRQYSEPIDLERKEFVKMLVIDGCFIIEFFLKRAGGGKVEEPLNANVRSMPTLRRDLLLMENQIPFFILDTILKKSSYKFPGSEGLKLVDLALHYLHKGKILKEELPEKFQDGKDIYHLLHLKHLCLLQFLKRKSPRLIDPQPQSLKGYILRNFKMLMLGMGNGLLSALRWVRGSLAWVLISLLYIIVSVFEVMINWKLPGYRTNKRTNKIQNEKEGGKKKRPRTLPTATELKDAGVWFKKKENGGCYLDVSFDDGNMEIAEINIQENSHSEFRNLLALEQSCNHVGNRFTSYVVLMDNLVDTAADVALLKRSGIIVSKLGCDQVVSDFFNEMRSGSCFNFDKHDLAELFTDVNEYCKKDHNRWRAKLMHEYFSNPWAIFSLLAAIILLGLTAVQTAYSIKSFRDDSPPSSPN